jgi:hypothetical protein
VTHRDIPRIVGTGTLGAVVNFWLTQVLPDGGACAVSQLSSPLVLLQCGGQLFAYVVIWIPLAAVVAFIQVDEQGLPHGLTLERAVWPAAWMFGVTTVGKAMGDVESLSTTSAYSAPLRMTFITLGMATILYLLRRRDGMTQR